VTVTVAPSPAKAITSFTFTHAINSGAGVSSDCPATIVGNAINVTVPFGTNTANLKASFVTTGASVTVGGVAQQSGVTRVNFSLGPVTYIVTAADSTTRNYVVTVTVASNTAKDITDFKFTSALNASLTIDYTASIVGTNITVTLPFGTSLSSLVPTVTITGASVSPSSLAAQAFTSAVPYVVTAFDSTTKSYLVTVTVALNSAKDITSFVLTSALNASLPSDCTGSIVGTNISVSVPYGTSLLSLIPTIAITGVSVSPTSFAAQNFTSPVIYTVTAADSTIQTYVVTVTALPNPAKAITAFNFTTPVASGVVTEVSHTVAITVPNGTNVTALVPTITITGVGVSPASGVARDFTSPVVYTVSAADTTLQNYTVTVTVAAASSFRISADVYNGPIWSSSDGGATWYSGGPTMNWTSITGSSDGTKLMASAGGYLTSSNIYRSTDGGASWNILPGAAGLDYSGLSSNNSGTILGASVYDGSQTFYYSIDSGTTWNSTTISGYQWWSPAYCSANGLSWIIMNGGDANTNVKISKATFDGAYSWSWTPTPYGTTGGVDYPNGYSISKDGLNILITFATHAHISTDFGSTWNPLPVNPGTPMTGSVMSGDATKLVVVVNQASVYTSTDGGSTWFIAAGLPGAPYLIGSPVCSYDGSKIAVLALYNGSPANSYIYISTDGGATFAAQTGPGAGGQAYWNGLYIQSQ